MPILPHSARTTPSGLVPRFDRFQRLAHWLNASLFGVLIMTAIPLYFGSFFGIVLPRHSVQEVHLWSGLALPVPIIASLLGTWGEQMRRDFKRFNYWTRDEIQWLRTLGKSALHADKFNPGQKLNAIFIGASIVVLLVTGVMLQWFRYFSISQREGATFVHDVFAWVVVIVIAGHIYMALTHREAMQSLLKGTVSEKWASQHAPAWLQERLASGEPSKK